MRAARLLVLIPALLLAAATRPSPALELPEIDFVRINKAARTMDLFADGERVYQIAHLQLGGAPVGAKRFEGDQRTPEGLYEIDWGNPASDFHLSLHISYPNADDEAYAAGYGRSAGGMIMIHGQPNALPAGRVPGDWTDGCVAVSNEEIEALWGAVPDGTPVQLRP